MFNLHIEYVVDDVYVVTLESEIDDEGILENLFYGTFAECLEFEAEI